MNYKLLKKNSKEFWVSVVFTYKIYIYNLIWHNILFKKIRWKLKYFSSKR